MRAPALAIAVLGLLLSETPARTAELGVRIPYQAEVSGVSGRLDVEVTLHDDATGGSLVWGPERHRVDVAADGRLVFVIGSALPAQDADADGVPDLDELDLTGLHLELALVQAGQTRPLSPRQALAPAAHAAVAQRSRLALDLEPGAVDSAMVRDESLSEDALPDEAALQFPDTSFPDAPIAHLGGPPGPLTTVGSITLTPPAPGHVIVDAFGRFEVVANQDWTIECGITTDETVLDRSQRISTPNDSSRSFALTRGYAVTGPTTFHLVCRRIAGRPDGPDDVRDASLTAFYAPSRY